jgi:hypothetical protein
MFAAHVQTLPATLHATSSCVESIVLPLVDMSSRADWIYDFGTSRLVWF